MSEGNATTSTKEEDLLEWSKQRAKEGEDIATATQDDQMAKKVPATEQR